MSTIAEAFKSACRLHTDHAVHRYLMSCAHGRWNGAEKALRHRELCSFYVAALRGLDDPEHVLRDHQPDYDAVHTATHALTDHMDEAIGFPVDSDPDYDTLAPAFFKRFHDLAVGALAATGTPQALTDDAVWGAWARAGNTEVNTGDILRTDIVAFGRVLLALASQGAAPAEATPEQIDALDDLVTLVRRLVRALNRAAPSNALVDSTVDYLQRKGFNKGPFRSAAGFDADFPEGEAPTGAGDAREYPMPPDKSATHTMPWRTGYEAGWVDGIAADRAAAPQQPADHVPEAGFGNIAPRARFQERRRPRPWAPWGDWHDIDSPTAASAQEEARADGDQSCVEVRTTAQGDHFVDADKMVTPVDDKTHPRFLAGYTAGLKDGHADYTTGKLREDEAESNVVDNPLFLRLWGHSAAEFCPACTAMGCRNIRVRSDDAPLETGEGDAR